MNNITLFILKKFSLEKIESNIKVDISFFYFLIKEVSSVQKVNVANNDKNTSTTILLAAKRKKDRYSHYSRRESQKRNIIQKVNVANSDKNISTTTILAIKSKEDCHFQHS